MPGESEKSHTVCSYGRAAKCYGSTIFFVMAQHSKIRNTKFDQKMREKKPRKESNHFLKFNDT